MMDLARMRFHMELLCLPMSGVAFISNIISDHSCCECCSSGYAINSPVKDFSLAI